MKNLVLAGTAAFAFLSATTPLVAQPAPRDWQGNNNGNWDRDAFWRGAPEGPRERIDFLQQRIDRGVADGSLDRREARHAQSQLDDIRYSAMHMRGDMNPDARDQIQRRLDDLSRQLHWARHDDDRGRFGGAPDAPGRDQFATDYDASRYYRNDPRYGERRLTAQDQVYRGSDGQYYCKRSDGTTGLIVGAVGGGVVGNVIDGGHNRVAGTLIGGALGALAGKAIDQSSDVRCR